MFIAGLGVGPTFSVLHDRHPERRAVPRSSAWRPSNLTFFRQIGGTVALAIVGTIFGTTFQEQLAPQIAAAGVPAARSSTGFTQASGSGSLDFNQLTGVGDLGATILASIPAAVPGRSVAPFVANIVAGIHEAFSLGDAQTFWLGVVGGDRRGPRRRWDARSSGSVRQRAPGA